MLALLQNLLAAQREKEAQTREYFTDVYVFGTMPVRVSGLTTDPIRWDNVETEAWWRNHLLAGLPVGFDQRSDYIRALHTAEESFRAQQHRNNKKNLLLISDGELDVGVLNRYRQAPPAREEIEAYQTL